MYLVLPSLSIILRARMIIIRARKREAAQPAKKPENFQDIIREYKENNIKVTQDWRKTIVYTLNWKFQ